MISLFVGASLFAGFAGIGHGRQQSNPLLIQLEKKVYPLSKAMELVHNGETLDGHGATLQGNGQGVGLHVGAFSHVTIRNLTIVGFETALLVDGANSLTVANVTISGAGPKGAATTPTGISLKRTTDSSLSTLEIHSCATGASLVGCSKVIVEKSDISNNDRLGLALDSTSSCFIRDNRIAFEGGTNSSQGVGIDVENGSNENQILRNIAVRCKTNGITLGVSAGDPVSENLVQGNDVSWTGGGAGLSIRSKSKNHIYQNVAAHCPIGFMLQGCSGIDVKNNLIVGNSEYGIEDDGGTGNSYDVNTFAKDTGSPVAVYCKGTSGSAAGIRLFQNDFVDYVRPFKVENCNPMTLQSNSFPGAPSVEIEDLAEVVGSKPLALDSRSDMPSSDPLVMSLGPIVTVAAITDEVQGVSVPAMQKVDSETVVEGSLTGAFQGEEEVLARYNGPLPVDLTFSPRNVLQIRVKGVPNSPGAFLALLADQSMAKGHPGDDSANSNGTPNQALDGDWTTPHKGWKPNKGKAGEWWQVDMGKVDTMTSFSIQPDVLNPDSFWPKFRILVSDTGAFQGEEKTVVTESNWSLRPGPRRVYAFAPVTGRYVRVVGDADKDGVLLTQFGVYGVSH